MGRPTKYTPEVHLAIVNAIERGAFAHVAAQAAGIGTTAFHKWMNSDDPRYAQFQQDVQRARSTARTIAETRVFDEDPFKWLRFGPGRDKKGDEGWTETSKIEHSGGASPIDFTITHTDQDVQDAARSLLKRLGESDESDA